MSDKVLKINIEAQSVPFIFRSGAFVNILIPYNVIGSDKDPSSDKDLKGDGKSNGDGDKDPSNDKISRKNSSLDKKPSRHFFRSYSIASNPYDTATDNTFCIYADAKHNGVGSNFLRESELGQEIMFIGPSGNFSMQKKPEKYVLFLATGTGIAPFLSMLHQLNSSQITDVTDTTEIQLYFGVRYIDEIFALSQLENFKTTLPHFNFKVCISQPIMKIEKKEATTQDQNFLAGRISEHYSLVDPFRTQAYLCGNPTMVSDEKEKLLNAGVLLKNIAFEKFTHAPKLNHP